MIPPPAPWRAQSAMLSAQEYHRHGAVLQIVADSRLPAPHKAVLDAAAARRGNSAATENHGGRKTPPVVATIDGGAAVCRLRWEKKDEPFQQLQRLREILTLLTEWPTLAVDIRHPPAVAAAAFAALVNAARLPGDTRPPCRLLFAGARKNDLAAAAAVAEGNTLARALTKLPPNELTVDGFAQFARSLNSALSVKILDGKKLAALKAGAILAVGRASTMPPCIVRLSYRPPKAEHCVHFVGKGVCYDTGGVNVKPARQMRGMKKDMAGAAAVLAIVHTAAKLKLPVAVDAWLALADNNTGAAAYRPDEVVTALNGKRIEVVHSDAEGRMILADALTLAARARPPADVIVSLATLTGTMHTALGEGMSGVFAAGDAWLKKALAAAHLSGERLCAFPMPGDYRRRLDSDIADIKQCDESGDADHILAALFLKEFVGEREWLHLDLSAVSCRGGLGAAPGPLTGFGVAWGIALLSQLA